MTGTDPTPEEWTGPVGHAHASRYAFGKPMHALTARRDGAWAAACNYDMICDRQYQGTAAAVTCGRCVTALRRDVKA